MPAASSLCFLLAVVVVASGAYHTPYTAPSPSHARQTNYRPHQRQPNYRPRATPARHSSPVSPPHYPAPATNYRLRPAPTPNRRPTAPAYYPRPSTGHTVIDQCTCFEKGNYYSPVSSNNCESFTQRTAFLPAETQKCPYGTQFDVKTCTCNYQADTVCPYNCQQAYHAPAKASGYKTCTRYGNIYAQVPNTNCNQFTQATATLPPQRHYCPYGLQFDLKTCVCNYPKDTHCYV